MEAKRQYWQQQQWLHRPTTFVLTGCSWHVRACLSHKRQQQAGLLAPPHHTTFCPRPCPAQTDLGLVSHAAKVLLLAAAAAMVYNRCADCMQLACECLPVTHALLAPTTSPSCPLQTLTLGCLTPPKLSSFSPIFLNPAQASVSSGSCSNSSHTAVADE